jgi:cytochrome subunit of sulfide dehydrogenase
MAAASMFRLSMHRPLASPPPIREANGGEGSGVGGTCARRMQVERRKKNPPPGSLRSPPSPPFASRMVGGIAAALAIATACSFAPVANAASVPPPGAASCTGCHASGTKTQTDVPRIAGRNPAEIIAAMEAFRSGQKPATVMDRIAKGFSEAEIRAIAEWLGSQK